MTFVSFVGWSAGVVMVKNAPQIGSTRCIQSVRFDKIQYRFAAFFRENTNEILLLPGHAVQQAITDIKESLLFHNAVILITNMHRFVVVWLFNLYCMAA